MRDFSFMQEDRRRRTTVDLGDLTVEIQSLSRQDVFDIRLGVEDKDVQEMEYRTLERGVVGRPDRAELEDWAFNSGPQEIQAVVDAILEISGLTESGRKALTRPL